MTWQPIVLFGMAGIFAGGVASFWKDNRKAALVLAVIVAALVVGGVLWLL